MTLILLLAYKLVATGITAEAEMFRRPTALLRGAYEVLLW